MPGRSVKLFIDNFTNFLEVEKTRFDRILPEDLNISSNVNNDASHPWILFMEEFVLIQHVKRKTHKSGSILDHVTTSGKIRVNTKSNTLLTQSDHFPVCFSISNWKLNKHKRQIFYRIWKLFRPDLYLNLMLSTRSIEQTSGVDKAWKDYLAAEENILNDHSKLKSS